MSKAMGRLGSGALMPEFRLSPEARRFLLMATYERGLPRVTDKGRIPLVLWTLSTSRIDADGASVEEAGPRYQLFVGPMTDVTTEFVVELDAGKPIAFRLDPTLKRAASYLVSIDHSRLSIQASE